VKENPGEVMTRTASVMNFKKKQLQDFFEASNQRMTPIINDVKVVDETMDDIKGLIM